MSPKFNIKIMGTKAKGCKFFKEFIVCNAIEIFFKFKLGFELRTASSLRSLSFVMQSRYFSNLNSVLNCE